LASLAQQLGVAFTDLTAPQSRWFSSPDGLRLHALDWGGEGPPALLLHGGSLTARTWDYVALGLRAEFRLIALDIRGHGESGWADDYQVEHAVADAHAVLDALELPRVHVVGMSLGGLIGAELAFAAPERIRTLTLIDISPGNVFEASLRIRDFLVGFRGADSIDDAVEQALRVNPRADRARVQYRMQVQLRQREDGRWHWKHDPRRPIDNAMLVRRVQALGGAAPRFEAPFLLVRGARSKMLDEQAAATFAACFPNGRWLNVSDAGHNVQEDNPAELIATMRRFWSA
jgi:pimeloyl-ACP methyl ester carboxylesterase